MLRLACRTCNKGLLYQLKYHNNIVPSIQILRRYSSSDISDSTKSCEQVYYGILTPQIRAVKVFSLLSSGMGLGAQPILYQQASSLGAPITVALFGFLGFFTFVTPFLLHSITKKYVTHIYFNPDNGTYSATLLNFFLKERKVTFTKDEVVVPEVPGMFTSFHVRGLALFVDPRLFEEPKHYAKLMGYDKPLDFKMNETAEKSNPEAKK